MAALPKRKRGFDMQGALAAIAQRKGFDAAGALKALPPKHRGFDAQAALAAIPAPAPVEQPHHASLLQKIADYAEVPFDLANAAQRSRLAGHGEFGKEFHDALDMIRRDPVGAAEEYGLNSPGELQYGATHRDPLEPFGQAWARFNMKHPKETAAETFIGELGNPSNALVGGVVGGGTKGVGLGLRALAGVERPVVNAAPRAVLGALDRFADIRRVAGAKGVAAVRSLLAGFSRADVDAMSAAKRIFGGLSPEEKREVVHLSQGRAPSLHVVRREPATLTHAQREAASIRRSATRDAGRPIVSQRGTELAQRGADLRGVLKALDTEQKQYSALLPETRTYNPDLYFPMKGAFTDPLLNELAEQGTDVTEDLRDLLRGDGSSSGLGVRKGTAGATGGHKIFATLHEAEQSGKMLPDWDPATALYRHLSRRGKNIAFERAMQLLPATLRRSIRYLDAAGNVPRDTAGKPIVGAAFHEWLQHNPMAHAADFTQEPIPQGFVPAAKALPQIGSPTMRESFVRPELAEFLKQSAAAPDSAQRGWLKRLDSFNRLYRASIIANPLVHGLWNMENNYLAAGGALRELLKPVPKAVEDEAELAGAHHGLGTASSFFGGDPAHLATSRLRDLPSLKEKIDKAAYTAWSTNQRITFDVLEKRYANALYYRLRRSGLAPGEAAEQVRKALGDYVNVAPAGGLQRAFFFYPWLKSNTEFWLGTLAHHPQYVNAPVQAIHRNNEVAGDPRLDDKYPTGDFTMYDGNGRYWSVPHPARILADLTEGLYGANKIALAHMTPALKALLDLGNTLTGSPKEPSESPNVVYDKAAPSSTKAKQAGEYALRKLPIPMAAQVEGIPAWAQRLRSNGVTPSDVLGLTGGFTYDRLPPEQERALREAFREYTIASAYAQTDEQRKDAYDNFLLAQQQIMSESAP